MKFNLILLTLALAALAPTRSRPLAGELERRRVSRKVAGHRQQQQSGGGGQGGPIVPANVVGRSAKVTMANQDWIGALAVGRSSGDCKS